ncbi:unnamed protein product [Prorocentrum cordatum]|uniref:Uncharacterized protein n=1 Tax=Prorocentrum cordatum TaxID=2364126 RepID=A0ABN9PAD1_9DINO|nr:unnamed protein product [Polarella glacialis]
MLSWSACLVESEAPSAGKPSGLGDEEHGDVLLVRTISDASTAGFSAATCAENEEAVLYGDEIIEVSSPGRRDAPFGQWPSSNGRAQRARPLGTGGPPSSSSRSPPSRMEDSSYQDGGLSSSSSSSSSFSSTCFSFSSCSPSSSSRSSSSSTSSSSS